MHVYVPDRDRAAQWYADVLGLHVVDRLRDWADDPAGPLTIEDPQGRIHLALFSTDKPANDVIAFGCSGMEFRQWLTHFHSLGIAARVVDHGLAVSAYFEGPGGNVHELTTYDVDEARAPSG